jgi:signal transduction histidine kinase
MSPDAERLSELYAVTLSAYLADPWDEFALNKAYEIGRDAASAGVGVLDMVTLHHDALRAFLRDALSEAPRGGVLRRPTAGARSRIAAAATFFAESLAPFEMQLRGYRENNALLREANEGLERARADAESEHRELQQTQSRLVQAAKMASLGELVAGIAHELNNPLTFVVANGVTVSKLVDELAASGSFPPPLDDKLVKIKDRLARMRNGFGRISDIAVNLRTFSRLDEGEFKTINMSDGLDSVLMLLGHRMSDRVSITKNYCPNDIVFCMPGILNQVVMNMLTNAIDAVDGDGKITLSTSRGETSFDIAVSDSGPGIPPEVRDRIFEPFFTTKAVGSGTGLGLSIAHGIVQAHKGAITLVSEPGLGTTFTVSIPLTTPGPVSG